MTEYNPDNWVVIKMKLEAVLATLKSTMEDKG